MTTTKRILVILAIFAIFTPSAFSQTQNPCSRPKRTAKGAAMGAGVGAGLGLLGALLNHGNVKDGLVQGSIAGGITGAVVGAPCNEQNQTNTNDRAGRKANDNPHQRKIAKASDLPKQREQLVPIYVRTINGADDQALRGILPEVFHPNGYGYVDPQTYQNDPKISQFVMDINVKDVSYEQQGGSDSTFWSYFGLGRHQNKQRRTFRISVTTFENGVTIPELSATETVDIASYQDQGKTYQFIVYQRNQYESYYLTDPAAEAAAWAIDYIFGLRQ